MFKKFNFVTRTMIDDDFTISISADDLPKLWISVVAREYEKRKLNVAKNVILFCQYYTKLDPISYIELIRHNIDSEHDKDLKKFVDPYLEDIKKYNSLF